MVKVKLVRAGCAAAAAVPRRSAHLAESWQRREVGSSSESVPPTTRLMATSSGSPSPRRLLASSPTTGLSSTLCTSPSASNHSSSPGPGLPVLTSPSRHSTQPSLPSYPRCQRSLPSAKPVVSRPPFLLPFPSPKLPSLPVSTKFLLLSLCLFLMLVLYTI